MMDEFRAWVSATFGDVGELVLDGEFQKLSEKRWYKGGFHKTDVGDLPWCFGGSWKTGESYSFRPALASKVDWSSLTKAARAELEKKIAADNATAAAKAVVDWERMRPARPEETPEYLKRKGLSSLYSARLDPEAPETIVIRTTNLDNETLGLHKIYLSGEKSFEEGQQVRGALAWLGGWNPAGSTGRVLICEGWATGATLHMLTGEAVVCAFSAWNLVATATALRVRYPAAPIVVCADDDWESASRLGKNPGLDSGSTAAKKIGGVCLPAPVRNLRMSSTEKPLTDWNDFYLAFGKDAAMTQLGLALTSPLAETVSAHPIIHMVDGKPKKPPEVKVVGRMLELFGEGLMKQQGTLFRYTGRGYFERLEERHTEALKCAIITLYGEFATSGAIKSSYDQFLVRVPCVPEKVNMFESSRIAAAFNNGTLRLGKLRDTSGNTQYSLSFGEWSPTDFLVNRVPMDYPADGIGVRNPRFESAIAKVFEGTPDQAERVRALRQMYGACVLPAFPMLFLLYGPRGSGKSSVIIPATRLVAEENISHVAPHDFKDFKMESMIGKLVNSVPDIATDRLMGEDIVKQVIDNVPIRFDRKFEKAVHARLPAVHIFGGNAMPRIGDGASGAHTRRWIALEFGAFQLGDSDPGVRDFGNDIYDDCPEGVLAFALEGLRDLVACGGLYAQPRTGAAAVAEWQRRANPLALFLEDLREGEVVTERSGGGSRIVVQEGGKLERKSLAKAYQEWVVANYGSGHLSRMPSKNLVFDALREGGFEEYKTGGDWYFKGLSTEIEPGARV